MKEKVPIHGILYTHYQINWTHALNTHEGGKKKTYAFGGAVYFILTPLRRPLGALSRVIERKPTMYKK